MYCRGQESDEKLHAAYHSSHLQGIRFQARCSYLSDCKSAHLCLTTTRLPAPIHLCGT